MVEDVWTMGCYQHLDGLACGCASDHIAIRELTVCVLAQEQEGL
jgi:hypothetical protein